LTEIRACLERPNYSLHHVIQLHIARLREQMELSQKLLERLEAIALNLNSTTSLTVEDLIQTIEMIGMFEKYYTPEQLDILKQRKELVGEERIRQAEVEWQELIEQARMEMKKGTDPTSESVQGLAQRWMELIQEFTGGDPGIEQSLNTMYQQEGAEAASQGAIADSEATAMWEYMGRAIAFLQEAS
jgi:hypothetical protein